MSPSDITDDDWLLDLLTCHRPAPWQSKASEKHVYDVCTNHIVQIF